MNGVKVSVIIPAYNIDEYIGRCLISLINQKLKEIEIIVVNDGSTDKTELEIKKYIKEDSRVSILNQENRGSIEARKLGLKYAKGEYILFVDGDDWLEINALEILYNNAVNNNSDIVLFHAFKVYGNRKEIVYSVTPEISRYSLKELLRGDIGPELCYKLIRLNYIRSNNIQFPSNISFAEDLATSCSLFIFNPKVSIEKTPLYNYYIRSTSITNTINSKVLEIDDAFVFIKRVLKENKIYDEYRESFHDLVYQHMLVTWILKYAQNEKVYSLVLYQKYKGYNIDIYSNPYIKEKILGYPLGLRLMVQAYHHSFKLGQIYARARNLLKRGLW